MTFSGRKRRGIFGKLRARVGSIFRKIEQVKKLEDVLKSSTPKDTEMTATWPQRIVDPKQSYSVEFGQSYL